MGWIVEGFMVAVIGLAAMVMWKVWEDMEVFDRAWTEEYRRYVHRERLMGRRSMTEDAWREQQWRQAIAPVVGPTISGPLKAASGARFLRLTTGLGDRDIRRSRLLGPTAGPSPDSIDVAGPPGPHSRFLAPRAPLVV